MLGFFKKEKVIYEKRTRYNKIKVIDDGDRLKLILDDTGNIHSLFFKRRVSTGSYWDICAIVSCVSILMKENMKKMRPSLLILGAGGGSISRVVKILYPNFLIFGVDIDIEVIKVGKIFFDPKFDCAVVADYQSFLEFIRRRFDVIVFDVFLNASIPFSFFLHDLWEEIDRKGDSVVLNTVLLDHAQHIRDIAEEFFPFTTIIKNPESSNFILFCSRSKVPPPALQSMRRIINDKINRDITNEDGKIFMSFLDEIERTFR